MDEENARQASGCGLSVLYNNIFRRVPVPNSSSRYPSSAAQSPRVSPVDAKCHGPTSDDFSLLEPFDAPTHLPDKHAPAIHKAAAPGDKASGRPAAAGVKASGRPAAAGVKASGRPAAAQQGPGNLGLSVELENMIHDHQRSKGSSSLVRASSGNVMVFGNLGNIRAPGAVTPNRNVFDYLPKTAMEKDENEDARQRSAYNATTAASASVAYARGNEAAEATATRPEVLCRALSTRLEPEELKEMGNEEYKNGRYAEAVAFYDRAILIDPEKAAYWSNKAAALMAMGQLLEAVKDCKEAVRIDPFYYRAHRRLATLYLRLGEGERAIHHFKQARNEASSEDIAQVYRLQNHLSKCNEARRIKDWHSVLKEAQSAVSSGADASPQVLAANAEALLALGKQEEAETALNSPPVFDIDSSIKFFGTFRSAYLLSIRAQVHMAAGRFEDAVALAQKAAQIEPSSREVGAVARKSRAVASARLTGNDLFKASKFREACGAYGEGLDQDPQNAILLCNRAACRSKLGQLEKAIEDCNAALFLRPSYTKARLRRADFHAKLERWEASVQDYEELVHQLPGDEEVRKALAEAQRQLKKQKGEELTVDRVGANDIVHITSRNQLKQFISSPGVSVALACDKLSELPKQSIPFLERMSKQYPTVKFLKMEVGEIPSLKEYCLFLPVFNIYKNGSLIKDIGGLDHDQLESFLMTFSN